MQMAEYMNPTRYLYGVTNVKGDVVPTWYGPNGKVESDAAVSEREQGVEIKARRPFRGCQAS